MSPGWRQEVRGLHKEGTLWPQWSWQKRWPGAYGYNQDVELRDGDLKSEW